MSTLEIISIVATFTGVTALSVVFTILYCLYARTTVTKIQSGKRDKELIDIAISSKHPKTKRNKKIISAIKTAFFILFLLIIIPLFMFALVTRIAGDRPVFGKTFMVVASGSMSVKNQANDYLISNELNDQFKKYDIIVLDAVSSYDDLKQYDVIAYRNESGVNIIHRIISVSHFGDGVRFTTRGDANDLNDEYAPTFSDVIGVYRGKHIGAVGIIVMFLQSYSGIITVVALLYCLVMIDRVSAKIEKCEAARLKQLLPEVEGNETQQKPLLKQEKTMQSPDKQLFTRKNFISFSLVALFSVLLVFVALCIDRSSQAIASENNLLVKLADSLKFARVSAGVYGVTCVALVAVYIVIFTVAVVFEARLAHINGKPRFSAGMFGIYAITLLVCLVLSFGLGLIIQPKLTAENVVNYLIFLGESIVIALLLYAVLFVAIGSVVMLIVNFRKVNKPFEFSNSIEALEDEPTTVTSNLGETTENTKQSTSIEGTAIAESETVPAIADLGNREKVFPALSAIDEYYKDFTAEKLESNEISLKELCEGFQSYLAKHEKLYYDIATIRTFISGMNATKLIILEGLSGTGKSSLLRYFSKYVNGRCLFLPVQATWRDRTNLLGYFNDFSKTYSETDFLKALYEANYDEDRINMFVLDELNISRVEYYFADFLSVLEYPEDERKLRIMHFPVGYLPPVKLKDGCIHIPANSYFVGTANKDDSTFSISDKVYDRAVTIDFGNLNQPFEPQGNSEPITLGKSQLDKLFVEATANIQNAFTAEDFKKFSKITDFIYSEFGIAFGNRVLNQIKILVSTYIACGGTKDEVLDGILARKVLSKLEGRFEDYIKDSLKQLLAIIESVYGSGTFVTSQRAIENLIKKL